MKTIAERLILCTRTNCVGREIAPSRGKPELLTARDYNGIFFNPILVSGRKKTSLETAHYVVQWLVSVSLAALYISLGSYAGA